MTLKELYDKRIEHGRNISWRTDNIRGLLSQELNVTQKFANLSDILDGFNMHGFHDVCNSLGDEDVGKGFTIIIFNFNKG